MMTVNREIVRRAKAIGVKGTKRPEPFRLLKRELDELVELTGDAKLRVDKDFRVMRARDLNNGYVTKKFSELQSDFRYFKLYLEKTMRRVPKKNREVLKLLMRARNLLASGDVYSGRSAGDILRQGKNFDEKLVDQRLRGCLHWLEEARVASRKSETHPSALR